MPLYLEYLLFGSKHGIISIILVVLGLIYLIWPHRPHPAHAFASYRSKKRGRFLGIALIIAGFIGIGVALHLSGKPLNPSQLQTLAIEANQSQEAKQLLNNHLQGKLVTRLSYYQLQKHLGHW